MKATRETSVRRLSSGSYVVSGVGTRSAVTGRFVSKDAAKKTATASDSTTAKGAGKK